MPRLVKGLTLLSQSDSCVETFQQQTGEWVIAGAGELHLEVCIYTDVPSDTKLTLLLPLSDALKTLKNALRRSRYRRQSQSFPSGRPL